MLSDKELFFQSGRMPFFREEKSTGGFHSSPGLFQGRGAQVIPLVPVRYLYSACIVLLHILYSESLYKNQGKYTETLYNIGGGVGPGRNL